MINLAPINYAKVFAEKGGPISRLDYARATVFGKSCFQAVAYIKEGLVSEQVRPQTLTAQPDGAGTHVSAQIACYMAISEALERWAVFYGRSNLQALDYGLKIDGSSNGFAAFPGLLKRQARGAAKIESIERHCLLCWWEGLIGHREISDLPGAVSGIELENPFSREFMVVLWSASDRSRSIAFGAGKSLKQAIWRAGVECARTETLVKKIEQHLQTHPEVPVTNIYERRIHHFASEAGFSKFSDRLKARAGGHPKKIRFLFDHEIKGPWSSYTRVWRTIIEPPSWDYLSDSPDYFFW